MEISCIIKFDLLKFPKSVIIILVSYLEFPDFLNLSTLSKKHKEYFSKNKILRHYIISGSITDKYKKYFYRYMNNLNQLKTQITQQLTELNIPFNNNNNLYNEINIIVEKEKNKKNNTKFINICNEINLDIDRTFPNENFTNKEGRNILYSILLCIAYLRPEIGYSQGMNYIAGALIHFIQEEELSFWIFLSLIDNYNLSLLFLKNMPDYSIRVYQLNRYIQRYLPNLYNHFKSHHISTDLLFSKWILTLFSSYLPFNTLSKVWDVFLIDGWKSVFRFSLCFLSDIYDIIINMDLDAMTKYLKEHLYYLHANYNKIIKLYFNFKITNKELVELRDDFYIDQNIGTKWENDQIEFVNSYRKEIEDYEIKMNENVNMLKPKFELICREYDRRLKKFKSQEEICKNCKIKLQVLIEMLNGIEKVIENKKINNSDNNNNHHFNEGELEEFKKIEKKKMKIKKDIEITNVRLLKNYKKLDSKKWKLEKKEKEKKNLVKVLEENNQTYISTKRYMLKKLSDKLKLSIKFVTTSEY